MSIRHKCLSSLTLRLVVSQAATPLVAISWIALSAVQPLAQAASGERTGSPVLAQATSPPANFPLPAALPTGTTVTVNGSSSMTVINEALRQRFQEKFPGTTVNLSSQGTDEALKALLEGKIDLAAVGRPLTDAEKAQQLVEVPVSREKIAIIVGPENSLSRSLSFEQFAKIFRGEITNWAEVGGAPGPIRFIDRPNSSDTRQALSNYQVFKTAPFQTGSNTTQVPQDDTAAVVQELGKDGISYAIASQVLNQGNVKIVALHETLPDDPRYPFSQPRGYVYRGEPSEVAQAFLGFATSAPGQEIVQAAKQQESAAVASPEATPSPTVVPETSPVPEATMTPAPEATVVPAPVAPVQTTGRVPWWPWWLSIPLLGGLLWWLLKDKGGTIPAAVPVAPVAPVAARPIPDSRLILTPRDCQNAYAYWELSSKQVEDLKRQGGRKLMLRLYDVTDITDMDRQTPHSVKQFDCNELDQDLHLPIAVDDRDYLAELGYVTHEGRWLKLARSPHVRVPACGPNTGSVTSQVMNTALASKTATVGAAAAAVTALSGGAPVGYAAESQPATEALAIDPENRIVLVPRNSKEAYAYWEISQAHKAEMQRQGGQKLRLRIYDATNLDVDHQSALGMQEYECSELDQDKHISIPVSDRDYIADLGYLTNDNRWLRLARSLHVHVPSNS